MTTTLPQPKLTQAGFEWIVVGGDSKRMLGAFAHAYDAAAFALIANGGDRRNAVGHTVFGWHDFFDRDASADVNATAMRAFAQPFYEDDWHNDRYRNALINGTVD